MSLLPDDIAAAAALGKLRQSVSKKFCVLKNIICLTPKPMKHFGHRGLRWFVFHWLLQCLSKDGIASLVLQKFPLVSELIFSICYKKKFLPSLELDLVPLEHLHHLPLRLD